MTSAGNVIRKIPQTSITKITMEITYLNFHSNLPGARELTYTAHPASQHLSYSIMLSQPPYHTLIHGYRIHPSSILWGWPTWAPSSSPRICLWCSCQNSLPELTSEATVQTYVLWRSVPLNTTWHVFTHWCWDKWLAFCCQHFQSDFLGWNLLHFA